MSNVMSVEPVEKKKIHPQKFAMWLAMASIVMMFAGLTSGLVVREAQGNWRSYQLPAIFWASTVVIVLSSVCIALAVRAFKQRRMLPYRRLVVVTLIMGIAFCVMQFMGFQNLYQTLQPEIYDGVSKGMKNVSIQGNPSESFLFIIAGLHLLHIIGGIVALAIIYFMAIRKKVKVYNSVPIEIVATYWHFIDVLWIYLFVFFLVNL